MRRIPTSDIKYKSLKRVDKTNALDSIVESINSRSNADFIKRLLDPNRKVIRNDDSHASSNNEAIEQYGQGFLYPSISIETKPSVVIDTEPKYDYNEIKRRQHYIESRFNDKAVSPRGAVGAYQIMPITLKDYTMRTGETGDLTNYSFNEKIRDFYMNRYLNSEWATKNGQSEYNRIAKALAAYNWGAGNLLKYLDKQKTAGKDIYTATDWITGLPKETRNYIKWILDGEDLHGRITNAIYNRAKTRVKLHQSGGILKRK